MSEIFSIEKLKEMSQPVIEIPGFRDAQTINVRVQKPNIMSLMLKGKIPNHLLNVAAGLYVGAKKKEIIDNIEASKEISKLYELYCDVCLVEPTYEEMKEIITDDQMESIFRWATMEVQQLESFRPNEEDGTDNINGQELPKETK